MILRIDLGNCGITVAEIPNPFPIVKIEKKKKNIVKNFKKSFPLRYVMCYNVTVSEFWKRVQIQIKKTANKAV